MTFSKGERVKTRRKLTFKGKTGDKTLAAGTRGTVEKGGVLRTNVAIDGDRTRRIDNVDLEPLEASASDT